jgi:hypothetical protein
MVMANPDNDPGIDPFLKQGRNGAGRQQNVDQGLVELEQKAQQGPFPLFPGERIGAEMFLTIVDLEQVQPFFLVTVQEADYFICRQVMPVLTD